VGRGRQTQCICVGRGGVEGEGGVKEILLWE